MQLKKAYLFQSSCSRDPSVSELYKGRPLLPDCGRRKAEYSIPFNHNAAEILLMLHATAKS